MRKFFYILIVSITLLFFSCSNYHEALCSYDNARVLLSEKRDADAMAGYLKALDAIGLRRFNNDSSYVLRGRVYSNIAYICGLYGDNVLAIKYFLKASDDYFSACDTARYVGNLLELARIYNRDSASQYSADSLLLFVQTFEIDSCLYGRAMDTRSIVLEERGEYYQSLVYAERAMSFPIKEEETELLPYRHLQLMKLYALIGLTDSIVPHAKYVTQYSHNQYYLQYAYSMLANVAIAQTNTSSYDLRAEIYQDALSYTRSQVSSIEKAAMRTEELHNAVNLVYEWEDSQTLRHRTMVFIGVAILLVGVMIMIVLFSHRNKRILDNQISDLLKALERTTDSQERKRISRKLKTENEIQAFLARNPDYLKSVEWKSDELFAKTLKRKFPQLFLLFENYGLNLTEQRICILILFGVVNSDEIADYCYISSSSVGKTKSRIVAKLNTTMRQLRQYLIDVI